MNNNHLPKAAFATHAAPNVSSSYRFIPTAPLLDTLEAEGFEVYASNQKRTRLPGMDAFAAHEIVLRPMTEGKMAVGDLTPQVVLMNAHNSTGALKFRASVEVLWCSNGCTRSVSDLADIRVRHSGSVDGGLIIDGVYKVVGRSVEWAKTLTQWQSVPMGMHDRLEMA